MPYRPDSSDQQQSPPISPATWDSLVQQLSSAVEEGRTSEELRPIVRLWCDEARQRKLAPEQFLVVIKSQFAKVPALRRRLGDEEGKNTPVEQIVSLCIEEYFRAR